MSFADDINNVLNNNSQERSNFRANNINSKTPFMGRVLPLEPNQNPFVVYHQAWISYTKKDNSVTPLPVIVDPNSQNDKLAQLLNEIIQFNKSQGKTNEKGNPVDAVKIASGRFPLRIATRATFLGVKVQNSNNTLSEVRDANGNQAVEAFDLSYSGMRAIFEKLKPKVPYMYNGQALFNDAYQFITPNQTFAISLEFANDNKGPGSWNIDVIQQVLLPQMTFNYLEKNQDGTYKYVPDIVKERQPLYKSDPQFYENVYQSVLQSYQVQKQQLAGTNVNPFSNEISDEQLPFNNQTDVVAGMTGQGINNFNHPNTQPQATIPQAPISQPQQSVQQPMSKVAPQQTTPVAPQPQATTAPVASQVTQPVQQPVQPQPTQSVAPQATNDASNNQSQSTDLSGDFMSNLDSSSSVDDFLNNL